LIVSAQVLEVFVVLVPEYEKRAVCKQICTLLKGEEHGQARDKRKKGDSQTALLAPHAFRRMPLKEKL
jgi:hypothetical protein